MNLEEANQKGTQLKTQLEQVKRELEEQKRQFKDANKLRQKERQYSQISERLTNLIEKQKHQEEILGKAEKEMIALEKEHNEELNKFRCKKKI